MFYGRVFRKQSMYGFGRVQSQAIIDSIKHCELTVITDGRDDLLIHCLNPNQSYAASLDRLDGLYYVVLQKTGSFSDLRGSDTLLQRT